MKCIKFLIAIFLLHPVGFAQSESGLNFVKTTTNTTGLEDIEWRDAGKSTDVTVRLKGTPAKVRSGIASGRYLWVDIYGASKGDAKAVYRPRNAGNRVDRIRVDERTDHVRLVLRVPEGTTFTVNKGERAVVISLSGDASRARPVVQQPAAKSETRSVSRAPRRPIRRGYEFRPINDRGFLANGAGKPMDVTLSNAPVVTILRMLAREARVNIVINSGVKGNVTVDLKKVPARMAIQKVIAASGFDADYRDDLVVVKPSDQSIGYAIFKLRYIDATEAKKVLKDLVTEGTGKITIDPDTNQVFMYDRHVVLNQVQKIVTDMDRAPRQVLVEGAIVEIALDNSTELGVGINAMDKARTQNFVNDPDTVTSEQGFFFKRVFREGITVLLKALQDRTQFTLLSRPRILALNDKEAQLIVGKKLGYKVTTTTTTGTQESVEFLEVGTQLKFTPHITENDEILMDIHPEISDGTIDGSTGLPTETTTEASTKVKVENNQTLVIGGLLRERVDDTDLQVPILGDIPLLGWLFRKNVKQKVRSEIMIFMTPRIIADNEVEDMKKELETFERKFYDVDEDEEIPGVFVGKAK
jgi:type IV pilus assembly protein PilQ